MIRLIFTIFTIICYSLPFIIVFDYKFGKALPLSFIFISFLTFLCSSINNFSMLKYLILIGEVLILFFVLVYFNKCKKKIYSNLFKPSTIIFIVIFIMLYFILRNRMYSYVDDYYFWGVLVRDGIKNNSLYTVQNSLTNIGSYPPFFTLLEISFCKLLGYTEFVDGISIFAVSSFSISLFFHMLDQYDFSKKTIIHSFFVTLIIICSTLIISTNDDVGVYFIYNTTLIDWPMGFLFGYCMYLVFSSDSNIFDSLALAMCCSSLILTKQVSVPLTLLILVTYLFVLIYKKKINRNYFIVALMPAIVYVIWQFQVKIFNSKIPLSSSIGFIGNALSIINISKTQTIISRFINAFFTRPISIHPINLSYFSIILIVSLVIVGLGIIRKDKAMYIVSIFNFLGGLGYALVILISYISVFGYVEGMTLVCFGRYMQTYTLASMILLLFLVFDKNNNIKKIIISLAVICLFVEPASISTLKKTNLEDNKFYAFKKTFTNFYNYTYNDERTVVLYSTGIAGVKMLDYVMDRKNEKFVLFNSVDHDDSYKEFIKVLDDAKYLIVVDSNDRFWSNCHQLFQDDFILDESIYTINYDENGELYLLRL